MSKFKKVEISNEGEHRIRNQSLEVC